MGRSHQARRARPVHNPSLLDKQISTLSSTPRVGLALSQVIDSNVMIGPSTIPPGGEAFTPDALKKQMDTAAIDRAVVYHSWSREHSPTLGNQRLMELIHQEPMLLPSWVMLPDDTGEMEPPEDLVSDMVHKGVFLARVFPKDHNFSLSRWSSSHLFSALQEHRMPTMIDLSQTNYDEIAAICQAFPDLPLILSDVAYRTDRYIYPLLRSFPHLYIETSRYQTHRGVEALCKRFGPERLIFGSHSPQFPPGPAAMTVRYALIDQESKNKILGGNLEGLMEGILR